MLLSQKWAAGLGGYLRMDLSYAYFPNYDGSLIMVNREPFIDGHLESFEDGTRNTCKEGNLNASRICIENDSKEED